MARTPSLTLVRVLSRGPELPNAVGTLGGVEYRRERGGPSAVYITLRLDSWRSRLSHTPSDDKRMKIAVITMPFIRNIGVEFCGSDIDLLLNAVRDAGDNHAASVLALKPLLQYLQRHFEAS